MVSFIGEGNLITTTPTLSVIKEDMCCMNHGKNVSKCFFSETTWTVETKLPRNDHWKVLYKVSVFYADRKSKIATTAGHRLTLDPMGKYSNAFFSETTNIIKAKLYMNVH